MEAVRARALVLDACSLLNLVASRRFTDIARAISVQLLTTPIVAAEVLYVRKGGGSGELENVDLRSLQVAGHLSVVALETPNEQATFVSLAVELDDGEAEASALAIHRGGALVTDDRAARRVLRQRDPEFPLMTTSEVIKEWSDQVVLNARDLARVLIDVEERARFRPHRGDPLLAWWDAARSQD
ncbi:MAG TPA: PIN domain-containing protein, partial [Chloroflexota bacterium]|nr:PIN domain-containing protein [Chloroflexota bacterium]